MIVTDKVKLVSYEKDLIIYIHSVIHLKSSTN